MNDKKTQENQTQSTNKGTLELGNISLHKDMPSRIPFTDAYHAIRRHEMRETQPGLLDSLRELAEKEARETGCTVSYHVSQTFEVFKVVTCNELGETRIALACEIPFADM